MTVRLPAARRRRQLLDVALEVFAERGFHPTSMNDIAVAAGVTKPVLYQHFTSKRELYLALLDDVGGRMLATIADATGNAAGPREQVTAGFGAYVQFVADHPAAFKVLFGGGTRRDEEFAAEVRKVERVVADAIAALIEVPGLAKEERRLLANAIVGMAEGASRHWMEDEERVAPEELARQIADLAWAGLRGVRGG